MTRALTLLCVFVLGCAPATDDGDGPDGGAGDGGGPDGGAGDGGGTDGGSTPVAGDVAINEFMAANASTLRDEGGAYPDWMELYNPTDQAISLRDWTVTDDLAVPDKHPLDGSLSVPAGGFLVLFADDDEEEGANHLGFNLDAQGEAIGLFDADGELVDSVEFGSQAVDVSAARSPDGAARWILTDDATPGESNGDAR